MWGQSTHTPRTRERGILRTRSLGDRAGTNVYLEAAERCKNPPAEAGNGWGTDGNEEDRWMDPRTGGEMPQNCTVEASPVFPGPSLPPPSLNPPKLVRNGTKKEDLPMQTILSNHQCDEMLVLMPPGLADLAAQRAPAASPNCAGRWQLYFHFLLMFMT